MVLALHDEASLRHTLKAVESLESWMLEASKQGVWRLVVRCGGWLHGTNGQQLANMLAACNPAVEDQPPFPTSQNSITVVGWHYPSPASSSTDPAPLPSHALGFFEVDEETYPKSGYHLSTVARNEVPSSG